MLSAPHPRPPVAPYSGEQAPGYFVRPSKRTKAQQRAGASMLAAANAGAQLSDRIEEEKEKNLEFERKLVAALLGT